jgi:hypothetical protein
MSSRQCVDPGVGTGGSAPVERAVRAATRLASPVPHARRWWVEPVPRGIELYAEVSADAVAWAGETRLAAGAGLFAAHLAVAALGTRPVTTLLPHSHRPGLLAVVRQGDAAEPTPAERTLHATLLGAAAAHPPAHPAAVAALQPFVRRAAEAEGVWAHSAHDANGRSALRRVLVGSGDAAVAPGTLLVLLASQHDLPVCQLRAGRAVERILLTARAFGHRGIVLAGPGGLDASPRALRSAGIDAGVAPQALLSISPTSPTG